ncbi:MAG: response regulator, partial [Acidobacteria bacterium]|nr:response regulator [Acidobacteriota bacterium]
MSGAAVIKRPIRTIIIDDEPLARTRIARLLEGRDQFEIVGQFGRPREGLLALEELEPDLVFLDIQMPGLSGVEVCRRLSTQPDLARTSVVIVSGALTPALEA